MRTSEKAVKAKFAEPSSYEVGCISRPLEVGHQVAGQVSRPSLPISVRPRPSPSLAGPERKPSCPRRLVYGTVEYPKVEYPALGGLPVGRGGTPYAKRKRYPETTTIPPKAR
jgi:hypothetical protein